jgi:hypothetical protein
VLSPNIPSIDGNEKQRRLHLNIPTTTQIIILEISLNVELKKSLSIHLNSCFKEKACPLQ